MAAHLRGGAALQCVRKSLPMRGRNLPSSFTLRWYGTEIEPEKAKPQPQPPKQVDPTKPPGRSFHGQLLGSIGARMRREKEKRKEYQRWRDLTDPSWRVTLMVVLSSFSGIAYWLGTYWRRDPEPVSTLSLDKAWIPEYKTTLENMQAAWADFIRLLGTHHVSTFEGDVDQHVTTDWSTHKPTADQRPFCIVYPSTTEEVVEILKICNWRRLPVVGYSGGTSLEGQYTPTRQGVSIDFRRMDKIIDIHKDDLDVVVQPGVGWELLNEKLAEHNLFFPPDPGPGAMIGGMVGTGCSGTNAYRYGTMREWVLSLTVVLADGTVIKTRRRPRKSSAGYDLTKLFIGSEGTLGLVTEATLKLAVKPESTSVAVCTFGTIRKAADCVAKVVAKGVPVAAVEILDDNQMHFINEAGMTHRQWSVAPTLFFKFAGTPAGVQEQVAFVRSLAREAGSKTFEFARNQQEQDELWSARKEALWSTMAAGKPGDRVWTGDVAVPMSHLPTLIEETKEDMRKSGLLGSIVGHVGDGNFHSFILYSEPQRERAEAVIHRMMKRAIELEGTITGEHGIGLGKRDYLEQELGESTVDAMRLIKKALDPLCLLNVDKIFRMEPPGGGDAIKKL